MKWERWELYGTSMGVIVATCRGKLRVVYRTNTTLVFYCCVVTFFWTPHSELKISVRFVVRVVIIYAETIVVWGIDVVVDRSKRLLRLSTYSERMGKALQQLRKVLSACEKKKASLCSRIFYAIE